MLTKSKVMKTLENLPDSFSIEEIIDQLILVQKIERGLKQSFQNETLSTKQAADKMKKWLK